MLRETVFVSLSTSEANAAWQLNEHELLSLMCIPGNKKGRGEIAPTFLIIVLSPVPVHPWSKAMNDAASRAAKSSQRSSAMPMKRFYL